MTQSYEGQAPALLSPHATWGLCRLTPEVRHGSLNPRRMADSRELLNAQGSSPTSGADRDSSSNRSDLLYGLALPYLLLVTIHVACGWPFQQPRIFADELGYLGHARYLSGAGLFPNMGATIYYHFGYALFLLPAFWLFEDPYQTYRAVVVTNGFLISLLYFPLRFVLHGAIGVPRNLASAIAFVTCLYPAFLLQSNYAWAENALIPGYAALVAAFWMLLRRPAYAAAISLGTAGVFLYAVHPRALILVPLVALVLVGLAALRTLRWGPAMAGVLWIGLAFLAADQANDHLRAVGWKPGHGAFSVRQFIVRVFTEPHQALVAAAGQLLYLTQSTYGTCLLGPVYVCVVMWAQGFRELASRFDRRMLLLAFVLITSGGLLAASALVVSGGGTRADHIIYGRYNEGFLGLHVAFGLALLSTMPPGTTRTRAISSVIVGFAVLTGIVLATRADLLSRAFVGANIFGIYPAVRLLGGIRLLTLSTVSAIIFLGLTWVFRRSTRAGLAAVSCCFLTVAAYDYEVYCRPPKGGQPEPDVLRTRIRDARYVSVDWASEHRVLRMYFRYQYLLPHTRLDAFNSANGDRPRATTVISDRYWPDAESLRARLAVAAPRTDFGLWFLPGAEQYHSATQSFMGMRLGWRRIPGVFESGFHRGEGRSATYRWTNGAGRLLVPIDPGQKPARLALTLAHPTRTDLRLVVNNKEVFAGRLAAGGEHAIDLAQVSSNDWLTIQLLSDTFVSDGAAHGPPAGRTVGVALRSIRLLPE